MSPRPCNEPGDLSQAAPGPGPSRGGNWTPPPRLPRVPWNRLRHPCCRKGVVETRGSPGASLALHGMCAWTVPATRGPFA
eukprot:12916515-Prorocentrum_lima.AAC.1